MAQAFITNGRLKKLDHEISLLTEYPDHPPAVNEQAVIVKNLLKNREYLSQGKDGVVKLSIPGPERVVEALVGLIADEFLE